MSPTGVKRRACVNCTEAKAKCSPKTDHMCDRCARLGKQCMYLNKPLRRKRQKNLNRFEVLEEAVVGMQSQLSQLLTSKAINQDSEPRLTLSSPSITATASSSGLTDVNSTPKTNTSCPGSLGEGFGDPISQGLASLRDADSLLRLYQDTYVTAFPFVPLRTNETASYLQEHSPFLLLCIIAVTVDGSHPQRHALTTEVARQVSNKLIMAPERSIELLCGLLILTAWHHHIPHEGPVQILLYMQLCITACYDLDLESKDNMTDREVRAFLGTYWLSVGLAKSLRKPCNMPRSKCIDQGIQRITLSGIFPSDNLIRPFMLMQDFLSRLEEGYSAMDDLDSQGKSCVASVLMGTFSQELDSMKPIIQESLKESPCLQNSIDLNLHFLDISVREVVVRREVQRYRSNRGMIEDLDPAQLRVFTSQKSVVSQLLGKNKLFLEAFQRLDQQQISALPLSVFSQVGDAMEVHAFAAWGLIESLIGANKEAGPLVGNQLAEAQLILDETQYVTLATSLAEKLDDMPFSIGGTARNVLLGLSSKLRLMAKCFPKRAMLLLGQQAPGANISGNAVSDTGTHLEISDGQLYNPRMLPNGAETFEEFDLLNENMWMPFLNSFDQDRQASFLQPTWNENGSVG